MATDLQPLVPAGIVLADTITKLPPQAEGGVIISSSHGGRYAGQLALKALPRGLILNDAGVGCDEAGIGSLALGERHGVAVATLSHMTCRIGEAASMWQSGLVSHANGPAVAAGVAAGMSCREAAERLLMLKPATRIMLGGVGEGRAVLRETGWARAVVLVDSAASVLPEDAGRIIVTGSHGALVGGVPAMALRTEGYAAAYNDAGGGMDGCGFTRLPALDRRGIVGVTVSAESARIGEALSTWLDGVISAVNDTAAQVGAQVGEPLRPFFDRLAKRVLQ